MKLVDGVMQFEQRDLNDCGSPVKGQPGVVRVTIDDVNLWLRRFAAKLAAKQQRARAKG